MVKSFKPNKQKVEFLMESLLLVEEFKRFAQNFFYRMIQANFVLARVWREASRPKHVPTRNILIK